MFSQAIKEKHLEITGFLNRSYLFFGCSPKPGIPVTHQKSMIRLGDQGTPKFNLTMFICQNGSTHKMFRKFQKIPSDSPTCLQNFPKESESKFNQPLLL